MQAARANQPQGKIFFDNFRNSVDQLKTAAQTDLVRLQNGEDFDNRVILIITAIVAVIAVIATWTLSNRFANYLGLQLDKLTGVAEKLEEGDLTARVLDPSDDETGQLGRSFNEMAEALQKQQEVLKERDVLENVSQLNNTIISNLELDGLASQFLIEANQRLGLQLCALYLYDAERKVLTLTAAQGLDVSNFQLEFGLGEGTIGQVGLTRHPYYIINPEHKGDKKDQEEIARFQIKTMLGQTLPSAIYHVPLVQGTRLLGVLALASLYPISENVRNVLDVTTASLATAISNAQAYAHIQNQAIELEHRQAELQQTNHEISRQRDELSVVNNALEEAGRVRGQFFSTMSHELRTPLTSIIGFAQILLRPNKNDPISPRQRENLERVLKNGQHLLSLVNTVLDLAKIDAGRLDLNYREVDLQEFLAAIIDQTQSLALQKGLNLQFQVEPGLERFKTDPDKLRQIVFNLVSNALKFTERGGVTVSASLQPGVSGSRGEAGDRVTIAVTDTGIGIEPEAQAYIFNEFYQVDKGTTRKYGGTGLGLSITRKLTDLMNGQLEVRSQPGQGSTFTVSLPLHPSEYPAQPDLTIYPVSQPTFATSHSPSLSETVQTQAHLAAWEAALGNEIGSEGNDDRFEVVVAVDDEPDVLKIIENALEGTSYKILALSESDKAFDIIGKTQPFAVILDIMMPKVNGWQLLQQIKSNPSTASIPVIIMSVVSDRSAGYVLGATGYLVKPIESETLLEILERLTKKSSPAAVRAGESGAASWLGSDSKRILVIDDEPDIREMLRQNLGAADFLVETADGGYAGLEKARRTAPDLILLDLMMPDIDGFEVLQRLKSNPLTASIPVVILTAKSLAERDYVELKRGSDFILQKGSQPMSEVASRLRQMLDAFKA